MKIIIVDDEAKASEMLHMEIENLYPNKHLIKSFNNVNLAETAIRTFEPDLVFLDINMPIKNGFEFLNAFEKRTFEVVFATAYSEYAIKAIKEKACDYLLKPLDTAELKGAMERAQVAVTKKTSVTPQKETAVQTKKIQIPSSEGISFLDVSEIIYCRSESNYVHIVSTSNTLFIAKTLKYITNLLPETDFARVHNSILVNRAHISKYIKADGGSLEMSNGDQVKISISKKALLDL